MSSKFFIDLEDQMGPTIIAMILLLILTVVLLAGWKVNNKNLESAKEPVLFLKEDYRENFMKK